MEAFLESQFALPQVSFRCVHYWAVTPVLAPIESQEHSLTRSCGPLETSPTKSGHVLIQNISIKNKNRTVTLWTVPIWCTRLMFYKDIFKQHLRDSSKTFCCLSRTSLRLHSYITRVTLSRPRDSPRLWLWLDGPLGGHDVDFLALIMMPAARTKRLMPLLSSARQILTGVSFINTHTGWSGKTKTVGYIYIFFLQKPVARPEWHHLPIQPAAKKKCVARRAEGQGGSRSFSSLPRKLLVLMNHGNTTKRNGFNYHLFIIHDDSHSANTIFYHCFGIHCESNACMCHPWGF